MKAKPNISNLCNMSEKRFQMPALTYIPYFLLRRRMNLQIQNVQIKRSNDENF